MVGKITINEYVITFLGLGVLLTSVILATLLAVLRRAEQIRETAEAIKKERKEKTEKEAGEEKFGEQQKEGPPKST